MAVGPAVTALILTLITFALVPGIIVGGDAYKQIIAGREFEKGTISPSLYIIEIHSQVQAMALAAAQGSSIDGIRSDITAREAAYEKAYTYWSGQLRDPKARTDLETSYNAAESYFSQYQQKFLPALRSKHEADAAALLSGSMSRALADHRQAVQAAAGRVQTQVSEHEAQVRSKAERQAFGMLGVALLIVAASIALGLTVLRSITDRVRRLTDVATVELPLVLEEVKRAALAGEEIPDMRQPASEGGDELAAAASAFNSVVATAVDLAAEQSRLRRSTSQMFINLGRRNHKLLSRTLTYITQLESDERDPATLQNLFRLDHLTTRMRRHAESLLVLAGSPPLRTWSRPVPVADVLRAALSEIETYDRVDIKELEPVEVRGASVSDLAHLLAELLENATAFSPPQTRVRVLGRTDAEGYTVVVVDEGIGMSPQELAAGNGLINSSEETAFLGDSRMLGLGVVGRLAARHGFRVSLTASPVGGVVAWVTLPTTALAPRRGGEPEPTASGLGAAGLISQLEGEAASSGASAPGASAPSSSAPSGASVAGGNAASSSAAGPSASVRTTNGQPLPPSALPLRRAQVNEADQAWPTPTVSGHESSAAATPAAAGAQAHSGPMPSPEQPPSAEAHEQAHGQTHDDPDAAPTAAAGSAATPDVSETGSIKLPPRAPEAAPGTGSISRPAAPPSVHGSAGGLPPQKAPSEGSQLKRRVRGAQLPDTGESVPPPTAPIRTDRTAQSVRGALQNFAAGRRSAADETARDPGATGSMALPPLSTGPNGQVRAADAPPNAAAPATAATPVVGAAARGAHHVEPALEAVPDPTAAAASLPRRVRGAQLPQTDLPPATAPTAERSAADVRAALSNFVAGRRAAEDEE
jgi:signal transduction histidine kinase